MLAHRAFYSDLIRDFLARSPDEVLGILVQGSEYAVETTQRCAWQEQIAILRSILEPYRGRGKVYFEYAIPRMGRRIDVLLLIDHVVFVIEFKVGEREFAASAKDQVWDYALDLKNFHESSHTCPIVPVLVATRASDAAFEVASTRHRDGLLRPICIGAHQLAAAIERALEFCSGTVLDPLEWESGRYSPTPTIIEAAMALYGGHSVAEISRSDASAVNLSRTSEAITKIIETSRTQSRKSVCFVTGVPGSGKTLVGLNVATQHIDKTNELYSVFLSGNGPLVTILREALARDKVRREREAGRTCKLGQARSEVKTFIQNVHHFRDECLRDVQRAPIEHVALFDEAQRAWNRQQAEAFMRRKRRHANFGWSEPEFLLSCMDRHPDWAVVVCLVGGG